MKKLALIFLIFALIFSTACSKTEVSGKPVSDGAKVNEEVEVVENEFCKMMNSNTRPVAVMIDNDVAASRC